MKTVMIISDATGETAERMVRAATLQFSEPVQIRLFSRVRLESELEQILEKAAELRRSWCSPSSTPRSAS